MQKTTLKKALSLLIAVVLIAAMALLATGCDGNNPSTDTSSTAPTSSVEATNATTLGEGATSFDFVVEGVDGKQKNFVIKTDKTTVGEALLELELIEGEDSQYGLYVKTVDGTTLDYDKDGKYWAFYVNGQYAAAGVDTTKIAAGETYMFKAE